MALNLKDTLEIVKRAGFDSNDRMKTSKSERRMVDGEFAREEEPLERIFEEIDRRRQPENMTFEELMNIDDL